MSTELIRLSELTRWDVPDLDLNLAGRPARPVVLVVADTLPATDHDEVRTAALLRRCLAITVLILGVGQRAPAALTAAADLVIGDPRSGAAITATDPIGEAHFFAAAVAASPQASVSLGWLLRQGATLEVPEALAAESSVYSMLLAGQDFQRWLAARPPARPPDGPERVRTARTGDVLRVTLARADRRNAVDTRMRHAIGEALQIAQVDDAVTVEVDALGPSFSAGGDLDEFGSATDPAIAHLVRVAAGVGQLIHDLRDRVSFRVHGACIGAGIEMPAFAGRISAAPGSVFRLPEVAMGLVPGAGGTVSIARRIGRQRALWFAVTGTAIDPPNALGWGLIDEIAQ